MAKAAASTPRDDRPTNLSASGAEDDLTPARLAEAAAKGDLPAAQTLVELVSPALTRAVFSVMGPDRGEADDVVQQALIAFVQALPAFRGESHPTTYATRIAVRTALAARKRHRSQQTKLEAFAELNEVRRAEPVGPGDELQAAKRRALIRHLLDELPTEQAEALALHVVVGLSLKDVAVATDAPLNTVKSRMRLAKQTLRRRIEDDPTVAEELGVEP
jgi:RNA polymerase sigma-70 factor (ECF subfamily)